MHRGGKFDEGVDFLDSQRPITQIEFWGLMVLGLNLVAVGILVAVEFLIKLTHVHQMGIFGVALLAAVIFICAFVVTLGLKHISRAVRGRRRPRA